MVPVRLGWLVQTAGAAETCSGSSGRIVSHEPWTRADRRIEGASTPASVLLFRKLTPGSSKCASKAGRPSTSVRGVFQPSVSVPRGAGCGGFGVHAPAAECISRVRNAGELTNTSRAEVAEAALRSNQRGDTGCALRPHDHGDVVAIVN